VIRAMMAAWRPATRGGHGNFARTKPFASGKVHSAIKS
jgi:hypothetical protein